MRVIIKKTGLSILIGIMSISFSIGQVNQDEQTELTVEQAKLLHENEPEYKEWLSALETPGVLIDGDQMIFSEEAKKLISDEAYRNSVYKPIPYTFLDVRESLSKTEIQKAFWQMLDLYPQNKEQVLQYIYAYDSVVPSDKVMTGAFYTYAFFDPKITRIENGKPNVHRPDIFEEYLRRTQEIITYIGYFRNDTKDKKI